MASLVLFYFIKDPNCVFDYEKCIIIFVLTFFTGRCDEPTTLFVLSQLVQEPLKIKKEPMAFLTLVGLGSVLLSPDSDFVELELISQTDRLSLCPPYRGPRHGEAAVLINSKGPRLLHLPTHRAQSSHLRHRLRPPCSPRSPRQPPPRSPPRPRSSRIWCTPPPSLNA